MSSRAVDVRHLSGLIYDGVDDFVRGPNVTGPTKRNHSSRCECAANLRRRRWIVLSVNFLARFSAKSESALTVDDLCRQRNLANAASTHSSVATRVGAAIRPIDGGRVCRSLSATATFHAPPHEHPIPPSWASLRAPSIVGQLAHGGELASAIFLPPVAPSN